MRPCISPKKSLAACALFACIILGYGPTHAETVLYRYKDANNRLVLSNTIPPEHADNGYQIVDPFGRVLHNVLPAPTPEEIAERKLIQAAKNRKEEVERLQAEQDTFLQKLYSHPDDAVRAKERKLIEIDTIIKQKQIEKHDYTKRMHQLESKAADTERSGKKIPERLLSNIASVQTSIDKINSELIAYEKVRQQTIREFDIKIARLKELKTNAGKKVTLNNNTLQGTWLIMALNGRPSEDNDKWEFVGNKFYQNFNGRRLSPDTFKIVGSNIELGYANIKVTEFGHVSMTAELAGFDYLLKKE